MAENEPQDRAAPEPGPEIAPAELLFQDKPARDAPGPPGGPQVETGSGEVFDLVDAPEDASGAAGETPGEAASAPAAGPAPAPARRGPAPVLPDVGGDARSSMRRGREQDRDEPKAARRARPERGESGSEREEDLSALVSETWSRSAEWGPTLFALAAWTCLVAFLAYLFMAHLGLLFLIVVVGGLGALVLSYPIVITLERPVRMTPEQAVRDFYGALSHHVPHYRRMWLLLGDGGRTSSAYGSFEGFKNYWAERVRTIKGDRAGAWSPLAFEVADYHGDKSAGQARSQARFTLKIFIRGRRKEGPVASLAAEVPMVRGPDRMWYLDNGLLPRGRA